MFLPVVVFFAVLSVSSLSLLPTVLSLLVVPFQSSLNSTMSLVIPDIFHTWLVDTHMTDTLGPVQLQYRQ